MGQSLAEVHLDLSSDETTQISHLVLKAGGRGLLLLYIWHDSHCPKQTAEQHIHDWFELERMVIGNWNIYALIDFGNIFLKSCYLSWFKLISNIGMFSYSEFFFFFIGAHYYVSNFFNDVFNHL